MTDTIILAAFGTTTQAKHTYQHLHTHIAAHFRECDIHWIYSSPAARRASTATDTHRPRSLTELIATLPETATGTIVVQSLHLLPGHEFHAMVEEASRQPIPVRIGLPLLAAPADYQHVASALAPLIGSDKKTAVLVVGHGTSHPCWTAYPALEAVLRRRFGSRLFLATLENYPDSSHVAAEIAAAGYTRALIIPFLLVAGMHMQRDIKGPDRTSWRSRLHEQGIETTLYEQGLGLLPSIADIFCEHIRAAGNGAPTGRASRR